MVCPNPLTKKPSFPFSLSSVFGRFFSHLSSCCFTPFHSLLDSNNPSRLWEAMVVWRIAGLFPIDIMCGLVIVGGHESISGWIIRGGCQIELA